MPSAQQRVQKVRSRRAGPAATELRSPTQRRVHADVRDSVVDCVASGQADRPGPESVIRVPLGETLRLFGGRRHDAPSSWPALEKMAWYQWWRCDRAVLTERWQDVKFEVALGPLRKAWQ
jgi:hypothetical protein